MNVKTTGAAFFYGNFFYGLCVLALSIEASLQQKIPLAPVGYWLCVGCATVYFYNIAYLHLATPGQSDPRALWFLKYQQPLKWLQRALLALFAICVACLCVLHWPLIKQTHNSIWALLALFPATGVMYYGLDMERLRQYNLRKLGWFKPFIISFVWAGLVTVYPVLFYDLMHGLSFAPTLFSCLLFLKNLMFIGVLCIMFDIKDHALDASLNLNTIIVKSGLRKTIFYVILPLVAVGFVTFIAYSIMHHFSFMKIILNTIPFVGLVWIAYSLHKRRSLLYYLIWVDGLMLLKSVCGIIGMLYF